jgi:DNA-binding response OmpR family regulator
MRRILIIDDDRDSADSIAMLLSIHGFVCKVASNGQKALDIAPEFRPEIVFLDIGMPGMDGVETALRLKQQNADYTLIALSGYGPQTLGEHIEDAGFDRHLLKPVQLDSLLATINATKPHADPELQKSARVG